MYKGEFEALVYVEWLTVAWGKDLGSRVLNSDGGLMNGRRLFTNGGAQLQQKSFTSYHINAIDDLLSRSQLSSRSPLILKFCRRFCTAKICTFPNALRVCTALRHLPLRSPNLSSRQSCAIGSRYQSSIRSRSVLVSTLVDREREVRMRSVRAGIDATSPCCLHLLHVGRYSGA